MGKNKFTLKTQSYISYLNKAGREEKEHSTTYGLAIRIKCESDQDFQSNHKSARNTKGRGAG